VRGDLSEARSRFEVALSPGDGAPLLRAGALCAVGSLSGQEQRC